MNRNAFDALTRHAGALSRRGSLRALGGAVVVSALAIPAAGKAGKRKNKKAKNPCKQQKAQCASAVTAYCANPDVPALCERAYLPCCEHFTGCNVEAGITCIFSTD